MFPSLLFTNTVQVQDNTKWVQLVEYNPSQNINNNLKTLVKIKLPSNLIESAYYSPYSYYPNIPESDYYEEHLSGPRGPYLRDTEDLTDTIDFKEFYRYTDNDLATGTSDLSFLFSFTDYLEFELVTTDKSYRLVIGLPIKENIHNFYINDELSSNIFPYYLTNTSLDPIDEEEILTPDYQIEYSPELKKDLMYLRYKNYLDTLVIDNLPSGDFTVKLFLDNVLVSSTSSSIGSSHYPKVPYLYNEMENALATCLFMLKEYRPMDYEVLIDSYLKNVQERATDDFPLPSSEVPVISPDVPSDYYSYYHLAWITISVFQNSDQLYFPVYTAKEISVNTKERFINDAVSELIMSIDLNTSLAARTIGLNKEIQIKNDISTSCLINLVLDLSIQYSYNPEYEYYAYLIHTKLRELVAEVNYLNQNLPNDLVYKIEFLYTLTLWSDSYEYINYLRNVKDILLFLIPDIELLTEPDHLVHRLKVRYILGRMQTLGILNSEDLLILDLPSWEPSILLNELLPNSYGFTNVDLVHTAWAHIIDNNLILTPRLEHPNKYAEIEVFLANILTRSYKYLPLEDPWFKTENLNIYKGIIGTVLKAINSTLIPLGFEYLCMTTSLEIEKAYGVGLDRWGDLLGLPRQLREKDSRYKTRIKAILDLQNVTKSNVISYITTLKENSNTQIINQDLPSVILHNSSNYTVVDFEDLLSKANLNDPVGVYIPSGEFYEFSKNVGVIHIDSYENELINSMFLWLKEQYNLLVILNNNMSFSIRLGD